ncbi:MAG: AbrB/MazE/SpoVT family DNA-binding domain-containing protein [Clostridia bacterium]|nr:AbrB/MazE/SpoVT family DNA-binding domain-containing protein [Clostridia bacterium]
MAYRKVDKKGKITIPVEIRKSYDIRYGDRLKVEFKGKNIRLSNSVDCCALCGCKAMLLRFGKKYICEICRRKIIASKHADYLEFINTE